MKKIFQNNEIVINNDAITVKQALSSFVEAATMGTEIFLIITIVGSILILGITTFASYSQDQHQNAILEVLGASRSDILDIYIAESLFIGIFSFIIALVMSIILTPLANYLIFHFSGFNNMILIPYKSESEGSTQVRTILPSNEVAVSSVTGPGIASTTSGLHETNKKDKTINSNMINIFFIMIPLYLKLLL